MTVSICVANQRICGSSLSNGGIVVVELINSRVEVVLPALVVVAEQQRQSRRRSCLITTAGTDEWCKQQQLQQRKPWKCCHFYQKGMFNGY
jgi:poly(3-hydroxybutyrate) depolymerase